MESKKQIEAQIVELVERLPPMPEDIDYLMSSSGEDDGQEERLIELVSKDPGLCIDLLHLANTYYGISENKIETIAEAVRKIGTLPLIQLVGVWYSGNIIRGKFSSLNHLDEYFIHSQDISLGCLVLSEICGVKQHGCEVLAAAGLIHDIGRLVILIASKQTTASLMGTSWNQMKSIVHEERDILGMDHCIVGEQICRKWSFSHYMQAGILRHHSPLINDDFDYLGGMIFMAHFVTCSDFTGQMLSSIIPIELCNRLGLDLKGFEQARKEYETRRHKKS